MTGSATFGDDQGRRAFINGLQDLLHQGRPEDALDAAIAARSDPRLDDGFAFPDPWPIIRAAKLCGYGPDHSPTSREQFGPFVEFNPKLTAIDFNLSSPTHFGNKANARHELNPVVETVCYGDDPFAFSTATRAKVVAEAQNWAGRCIWAGEQDDISASISVAGMERLYGSRDRLPQWQRDPAQEDLFWLESAIAAIAFHLIVKQAVLQHGVPKRAAIVTGSNDDEPFFAAIVFTPDELDAAGVRVWSAQDRVEAPRVERPREGAEPPRRPQWRDRAEQPRANRQPSPDEFIDFVTATVDEFKAVRQSINNVINHKDFKGGVGAAVLIGALVAMRKIGRNS